MALTYTQLLAKITTCHIDAQAHKYYMGIESGEAWVKWNAGDDHGAIKDLIEALDDTRLAIADILCLGYYGFNGGTNVIPIMFSLLEPYTPPDSYELTMDDMLNVMLAADLDEYTKFIGIVDAYRVGLWDKPFNAEFYAALARGFAEWA